MGLNLLNGFTEVLSLGAVIPFLAALTNPEILYKNIYLSPLLDILHIESPEGLLFPLTLIFSGTVIVASAIRVLLMWCNARLASYAGTELSVAVFRKILEDSYETHISRSSNEVINDLTKKIDCIIFGVMLPSLSLISSVVLLFALMALLIKIDPVIALSVGAFFSFIYIFIARMIKSRLSRNSDWIAREQAQTIKALQDSLGGIRDVLLDGTQEAFIQMYKKADRRLRYAQGDNNYVGQSPRYILEAVGIATLACLAYYLTANDNNPIVFATIGIIALAAQRILPALQQIYYSWVGIASNETQLKDLLCILEKPTVIDSINLEPFKMNQSIEFDNVFYQYKNTNSYALKGISLKIQKGMKVGIIGTTGCGKSTFLDILMGLLQPTKGDILVDGRSIGARELMRGWQKSIAHVPQSIFLMDASLEENIAFGIPQAQINHRLASDSAQGARINDQIESDILLGERGVRISGGQRQRVGIARALYKRASVLILDEATSALDSETEVEVMKSIYNLMEKPTVFIVAHRISTLNKCDLIIKFENGKIVQKGSYSEIFN